MGGRKSHHDRDKGKGRAQASKKNVRGFARGHGAHHRHRAGKEAPRQIGTGRDRTTEGTRDRQLMRMHDDELQDLSNAERNASAGYSIEELGEAQSFGAKMEGTVAAGIVVEVRKGNFLTLMRSAPDLVSDPGAQWKEGDILRTFVRGTLQQFDLGLSSLVTPGDEIEVIVPPSQGEKELYQTSLHAILTRVLPRRSEFRRLHPSGRAIQTLAANVDRVVIVASTAEPDFRPGFVDRVLVCAAASALPASLVLNKIDLGIKDSDEELLNVYRGLNIPVYKISVTDALAPSGDFQTLRASLENHRTLLTGHSGVGKSSLLRALAPELSTDIVRTGEVSTQTGKGTHTTTHARLFKLDLGGGRTAELVDTPGVREFTPADTDRQNLWAWFPEIAKLNGQCAFGDCTHTIEKNCAVLAAVERGEIHPRRHQSYVRIYQTLPM
ncbi:MAG TPA: ribosome small subunit-dependent GTPase A [Planctomycetota bacterium]|nr:ribosome small subunit-dependent GTPase A [Planctomycetota bacterium]